ncbi:hypothetical protein Aduo_018865 [Ancylostoma duodenale]
MVGVVEDPHRWWLRAQTTEFHRYLKNQLISMMMLKEVRVPKTVQKGMDPSLQYAENAPLDCEETNVEFNRGPVAEEPQNPPLATNEASVNLNSRRDDVGLNMFISVE